MKLVVLGGGESGVGTALLGKKRNYQVFLSDLGAIKPNYKNVLIQNEIDWEEKKHTEEKILDADMVMKSPGIPDSVSIVQKIRENKIEIVSEIEFASQFSTAYTIGITGSNGKTTTTLLTYHLLKSAGVSVGLAGNVGKSYAEQVANENYEGFVLELSSFQLDGIKNYAPHIAVITNITPDHLDRYNYNFKEYIEAKCRITKNQKKNDYLIYDADDIEIKKWLKKNTTQAQLIGFSLTKKIENGTYLNDKNIIMNLEQQKTILPIGSIPLEGKHNLKNAMAAATIANILRVRKETIRESMMNFHGVEHRMEKVLKIKNVQYINDSKATNVNSVFYALESIKTPIVWIAGGQDKGNDYSDLLPLVYHKVKAIICLGVNNQKLFDAFGQLIEIMIETQDIDEAVQIAERIAEPGETVLLSPACASFDLFENYQERGNKFKQAIRKLLI